MAIFGDFSIFKRLYVGFGASYDIVTISKYFWGPKLHFLKIWDAYAQKQQKLFFRPLVQEPQAGAPGPKKRKNFALKVSICWKNIGAQTTLLPKK